jgi:UDP-N-acetylmuramoyl-L-alanyl-D-glutamate--2,6-diaminopimelate ligase
MTDPDRDAPVPVPLRTLLPGAPDTLVSGVGLDSRRIRPGDLYVALPGAATHGARFAPAAIAAGAAAVLTDAEGDALLAAALPGGPGVPVVVVADPRAVLARVAAEWHGRPSERLAVYGITGTTGKTSTAFLIAAGLAAAGLPAATIGTLGVMAGGVALDLPTSTVTTPEAPDLQAILARLLADGVRAVAMEVSSHALALHRADWVAFDVAAFTNLGHDHLDFHRDQESYYQAKARLFLTGRARHAVVNTADPFGARLADEIRADGRAVLHTLGSEGADYRVLAATARADGGWDVRAATPGGEVDFCIGMLGDFNVDNALTALAMLDLSPLDLDAALAGLATAAVPGRMQRVPLPEGAPRVVVDFAHTPEAVAAALAALPAGRRVVVLGCGGDRDHAKRGPMGEAAARGADLVVVTDDNPRSEDPAAIRRAVLDGAARVAGETGAAVLDGGPRREAITRALAEAGPDGWVAILGKGHEHGQDIAGVVSPFDDVEVAARAWTDLREASDG